MCPVYMRNLQKQIAFDTNLYKRKMNLLLKKVHLEKSTINVSIVSDRSMSKWNQIYFQKKGPTDVISLPNEFFQFNNKRMSQKDSFMGEILICPSQNQRYALKENMDSKTRLDVILVHSFAHLLGYEHDSDSDFRVMRRKENQLMKEINLFNSSPLCKEIELKFIQKTLKGK
eukprot:TRINITY_DN2504_c1_g1_i4.p2 TRINITY_DN2504_c1_g1~~TRINITY_DN2504_c1_g1_i4.p2  ORF type:complete len:172 (+),score=56.42 TRINITY_DN2504_c1_g1_i4:107-622(+)